MLGFAPVSATPLATLDTAAALAPLPVAPSTLLLVDLDFVSPTAFTLHLADRYVPATWTGDEYFALVTAWSNIEESLEGSPGNSELTISNTRPIGGKPRFSDLIRTPTNLTGTYDLVGATVTFWQLRRGQSARTRLTTLFIEDVPALDDRTVRLRLRDATLALETMPGLTIISREDFPRCPPDLAGLPIPLPFGRLQGVPALPLVAGTLGRLAVAVDAVATTLTVTRSDGTDLDATDLASLRLMVDWEEVTFTGRTGNVLSGCTRGAASTVAQPHEVEAPVLEVLTNYVYTLGERAAGFFIESVSNVRFPDVHLQASSFITLDDTTALPGHHLVTLTIARTDVASLLPVTPNAIAVAVTEFQVNLVNGNADATGSRTVAPPASFVAARRTQRTCTFNLSRGGSGGNTAGSVHITGSRYLTSAGIATAVVAFDYTWPTGVVGPASFTHSVDYDDGATAEVLWFAYSMVGTAAGGTLGIVFSYDVRVTGYPDRPGGPYTSAIDACLGMVRADVVGISDSLAAPITGAPNTLLENPADVLRYIVTQVYPTVPLPLHGASWAASRAALATRGLVWALLYGAGAPLPLSDLRQQAARQSAGALYLEGGAWVFRVAEDALVIDRVLDYDREIWDGRAAIATRTPQSELYTSLLVSVGWDFVTAAPRQVLTVDNGAALPVQTRLELPWIQAVAPARDLAAYWLDCWERPRWDVELIGWDALVPLGLGEYVSFSHHPVLEAHGGAALPLEIRERGHLLGDDNPARIRLRALEGCPWPSGGGLYWRPGHWAAPQWATGQWGEGA